MSQETTSSELLRVMDDVRAGRTHHALFASAEEVRQGTVRVLCRDGCFTLNLNEIRGAIVDDSSAVLGALIKVFEEREALARRVNDLEVRCSRELGVAAEDRLALLSRIKELDGWRRSFKERISDLKTASHGQDCGLSRALRMRVDEVFGDTRICRALDIAGIETVGDLAKRTEADILKIRNLGKRSLNKMRERLGEIGVRLLGP
jgi:hypothetical protein